MGVHRLMKRVGGGVSLYLARSTYNRRTVFDVEFSVHTEGGVPWGFSPSNLICKPLPSNLQTRSISDLQTRCAGTCRLQTYT